MSKRKYRVRKVKVEGLGDAIVEALNTYNEDIRLGIADASLEVADEGAKKLRETKQPSGQYISKGGDNGPSRQMKRRQWTKYARGWKVKTNLRPTYVSAIIHNKDHYQLTHLLEYGHITRNGTRTRAFKHIQPVEEECKEKFVKQCEEVIKRGGK